MQPPSGKKRVGTIQPVKQPAPQKNVGRVVRERIAARLRMLTEEVKEIVEEILQEETAHGEKKENATNAEYRKTFEAFPESVYDGDDDIPF